MGKRLLYIVSVLLGVAGFCAIPFLVGVHDLLRTMRQVGWPSLVLYVANASGTLVLPALGWWLLMRTEGIPASLGTAVQANLMGFPLDFVVPSAYLGGEPLKTVYIARVCHVPVQRVLATIVLAKFQELGGLVLSMILATALFVWHTDAFTRQHTVLLCVVMLILASLLGVTVYTFAGRCKPLVTLLKMLARCHIFRYHMAWLQTTAEEIERLMHLTLTEHRRVFLLAQGMMCLSAVSLFIRPWIFFWNFPDVSLGFNQICALFVLTNLVNLLTVVPGSLGWFEATMAAYASAVGLGEARGAAFALVTRLADLTFLILGSWLIVHYGLTHVARDKTAARAAATTETGEGVQ